MDLQNDFCPGGALPVKEGNQITPLINDLQKKFELVAATQDWHPAGHESFALIHNKAAGEIITLHGLKQVLWPVHCVQESRGAELVSGLNTEKIDRIFHKGIDKTIDSYSAFFDNGHKKSTGLGEYLKKRGVTDVYIAGLATDYCVKYSALDARKLGFKTSVVIDACRGIDLNHGDIERAIEEMKKAEVKIIHSRDIIGAE